MLWTTRLDSGVCVLLPWGKHVPIPQASSISGDAHKDQQFLLFRQHHSVTSLYSPGRKIAPRARSNTRESVNLRTASIYHHPRRVRESRQPILKINELISKWTNPLSPGGKGERATAREFYICSLLPPLPTDLPRRKPQVPRKGPTQSTPWHWAPMQASLMLLCSFPKGWFTALLLPPHNEVTFARDSSWNHSCKT